MHPMHLTHAVVSESSDRHGQCGNEDADDGHEAAQEDDEGQDQRPANTKSDKA